MHRHMKVKKSQAILKVSPIWNAMHSCWSWSWPSLWHHKNSNTVLLTISWLKVFLDKSSASLIPSCFKHIFTHQMRVLATMFATPQAMMLSYFWLEHSACTAQIVWQNNIGQSGGCGLPWCISFFLFPSFLLPTFLPSYLPSVLQSFLSSFHTSLLVFVILLGLS